MAEYIEREAAIKAIDHEVSLDGLYANIKAIPAADVRPERHGEWKHVSDDDQYEGCYFCSECKEEFYYLGDNDDMLPKGDRKMAPFVSERIGALPVERTGYKIKEFAPAHIGVSRSLTVDDLKKRGFGEALYSNTKPAERPLRMQLEDMVTLNKRISRREEWMAAQTMINNFCKMQEMLDAETKGEVRYVEFYDENNSDHTYTVANPWNSKDANITGDVYTMCEMLASRGLNATDLVVGSDVVDAFYNDEKLARMLDKNSGISIGTINERIVYPGVSQIGPLNFRGHWLMIYVVSSTYEDEKGVTTSYFPKTAAMVTYEKCGHTMYGQITQMPYGSIDFKSIAAKRVPKLIVDNANDTRSLCLKSRPLTAPITYCPYIYAADVVS